MGIKHYALTGIVSLALLACNDDGGQPDPRNDASLAPEYFACEVPSDCVVVPASCCDSCGAPVRGDAIAVAKRKAAGYAGEVCKANRGCPACAPLFIDPTLVATCRAERCELVDLYEHEASECTADDECGIRTPDCCPCGGDVSRGRLVAVSSANVYEALVCDPEQACPECAPIYPSEVTASCDADDRCMVHDPRVPDAAAACEVDGVVYPSGTDGVGDPVSCNECSCDDGQLICTEIHCPEPCPSGTAFGIDCASCGPTDACKVVRTGCLPTCDDSNDCDSGSCDDELSVCLDRCG